MLGFFIAKVVETLSNVLDILNQIKKKLDSDSQASRIDFYTTINGKTERITHMFLKVSQNLPLNIQITDKFGNPANVDGAPQWAITDASLGAVEASEDGLSATFKPAGPIGSLKVQVTADADLGEGVKNIIGELDLDLVAGEAVGINIAAGQPVDA